MTPTRILGVGAILLGTGIAVSAVLGPLVLKVVTFRTSENIENQFAGGEIVSLAVVAPALIGAGALWLRGHRLAPVLALGPSLYAVYTYATVVLGQEYARYAGNVEQFFPLYAGLVAGGVAIAATAWVRLGEAALPVPPNDLRRMTAGVFLALGSFFALAWAAQIRLVVTGNPPTEYQEAPTLFWLIKLLDFGVCIPALLVTGTGLLRQWPFANKATYALAGFSTCLIGSIAGMAVRMQAKHDPAAEPVMLVVALGATVGLVWITGRLLSFYLRAVNVSGPANTVRRSAQRSSAIRV